MLAHALVRVGSWIAPAADRAEMRAEWRGELERLFAAGAHGRAVAAALGAVADGRALRAVRRERRRREEGMEETLQDRIASWARDLRLAGRGLRRSPGFTLAVVGTLAIGIAGATTLFTLVDRVVLAPLPHPEPERLVRLENRVPGVEPDEVWNLSTAQWLHVGRRSRTLDALSVFRMVGSNAQTPSGPARVRMATATPDLMALLGARAELGRVLDEPDGAPDAPLVAVLSHEIWQRAFASDPGIVGRTLSLDGMPVEVVGVTRAGLALPGVPADLAPDLWLPLQIDPEGFFGNNHVFQAIGRLAAGATPEAAETELARMRAELPAAFPDAYDQAFFDRTGFRTAVVPLKEHVLGDLARNLWLLLGSSALVLLVAVANAAGLFVVRSETRRHDRSVRAALGAGRGALARSILAEGAALGLLSGAVAVLIAAWALPALVRVAPDHLPRLADTRLGPDGAAAALLLGLACGLALALFPAAGGSRLDLSSGGLASLRTRSAGGTGRRFRSALVVGQLALALTLLVGAGLMVEGIRRIHETDVGIRPEGLLAADFHLSFERYPDDRALWPLYRDLLDEVRRLPGVTDAGLGEAVPVSGAYGCTVQAFEDAEVGERLRRDGLTTCAGQVRVTPGYFEALGMEVVAGRTFTREDVDDPARAAVVVSRAFAERFWPGEDPLGKGVNAIGRAGPPWARVVGVVEDVPRAAEGGHPFARTAVAVYYPVVDIPTFAGQWYWWPGAITLVARTTREDPTSLVAPIRAALQALDPEAPLSDPRLMTEVVAEAGAHLAFVSLLLGVAAAASLLLAAIGLYGVVAYLVAQRTREIGMRIAIGARPGEVERMIVRGTLLLAAAGITLGLPLAGLAAATMERVLAGVVAPRMAVYALAAVSLLLVALAAK